MAIGKRERGGGSGLDSLPATWSKVTLVAWAMTELICRRIERLCYLVTFGNPNLTTEASL